MLRRPTLLFLLGFSPLVACGTDAPAPDSRNCRAVDRVDPRVAAQFPRTPNDDLADLTDLVSTFGGYRIDFEASRMTVLMTEPNPVDANIIRDEVAARIGPDPRVDNTWRTAQALTEAVPYNFRELLDLYHTTPNVMAVDGVVFRSLNSSIGKIEFGVLDAPAQECVEQNLLAIGIPEDASVVMITEPYVAF